MRWLLPTIFIGLSLALAACLAPTRPLAGEPQPAYSKHQWVRTRNGWEQPAGWSRPTPKYQPRLHPLTVAAGELLLALMVVAWRREEYEEDS